MNSLWLLYAVMSPGVPEVQTLCTVSLVHIALPRTHRADMSLLNCKLEVYSGGMDSDRLVDVARLVLAFESLGF